jgi:hypothetical protein
MKLDSCDRRCRRDFTEGCGIFLCPQQWETAFAWPEVVRQDLEVAPSLLHISDDMSRPFWELEWEFRGTVCYAFKERIPLWFLTRWYREKRGCGSTLSFSCERFQRGHSLACFFEQYRDEMNLADSRLYDLVFSRVKYRFRDILEAETDSSVRLCRRDFTRGPCYRGKEMVNVTAFLHNEVFSPLETEGFLCAATLFSCLLIAVAVDSKSMEEYFFNLFTRLWSRVSHLMSAGVDDSRRALDALVDAPPPYSE